MSRRVAIGIWEYGHDSVSRTLESNFHDLNYQPITFKFDQSFPKSIDYVFTFAPWGRLNPIINQLAQMKDEDRPNWIHWNTEDPPDLRIPWIITRPISSFRAWFDRLNESPNKLIQKIPSLPIMNWINSRLYKFRYVGEYYYSQQKEYLTVLADISEVYSDHLNKMGIRSIYAPWSVVNEAISEFKCERDIDVVWLGTRRTKRRSKMLDKIREDLLEEGISIHIVDGVENSFIHGEERNKLLSRAKISLNLLPTWYDNTLVFRFPFAAASKSMVITEKTLNHCPTHKNKTHYVAVHSDEIVPTIQYYLENEEERKEIAHAAYNYITKEVKIIDSVQKIMAHANQ